MESLIAIAYQALPIVLMFVVLYFFMIKPQRKRDAETSKMRNEIKVGDYIQTIGGVIGRVVAVRENQITLETGADRVKLHFAKWAIQGKTDSPVE